MFWKVIGKLFELAILTAVLGVIALGGYFWRKSGQPMQVDEAQRMVPGITFREFWQSRVEQWQYWDGELKNVGKNGACENSGYLFFAIRAVASGPFVADLRSHELDAEYTQKKVQNNNGVVPPDELLYEASFLDAWWSMIEHSAWHQYAHDPGFPVKELGQRRACSTTYSTSAANGK